MHRKGGHKSTIHTQTEARVAFNALAYNSQSTAKFTAKSKTDLKILAAV